MPGQSCHFYYTFSPTAVGSFSGTSTFSTNAGPVSIKLQGEGVPGCTDKPDKPTLTKPPNGSAKAKSRMKLEWTNVTCEKKYKVIVKNAATKAKVFKANLGADVTDVKTAVLPRGVTYNWFVKACNTFGCAKSTVFRFTLKP